MFSKIFSLKCVRPYQFQQVFRYAKYVQKSKEDLKLELENKRFNLVRDAVTSALKRRKSLSVSEWKSLDTNLKTDNLLRTTPTLSRIIFAVLLSLRLPNDSLQNARNFIEACNIDYDLNVKRTFIELYAKKASEDKLTADEERDLVNMLVSNVPENHKLTNELTKQNSIYFPDVMSS